MLALQDIDDMANAGVTRFVFRHVFHGCASRLFSFSFSCILAHALPLPLAVWRAAHKRRTTSAAA